ncbi:SEL1-like repeat protein [Luteibacter yeojuensis]|uniref:SEL1-like repeat protein n=1 Tax=Luteibacter yeojuensis TaxID=345309 RepID=UPI0006990A74|nr:SEL1-like repeat protein [Luteibacter yeojuensis]
MKGSAAVAVVAASVALAACHRADRPTPPPGQEVTVAHILQGCPGGLERLLPGEYYFCEGASNYWAGSYGLARTNLVDAARWADKDAQFVLGLFYFNGDHVPQDRPQGVAWLALAAERHRPDIEATFVEAYRMLTPAEKKQADAWWMQMKPLYSDAIAAPRAEKRFDRGYRELQSASLFGGMMWISGLSPDLVQGSTLQRWLKTRRDKFFEGYETHVWVGDATLVPLGSVAPPKDAPVDGAPK